MNKDAFNFIKFIRENEMLNLYDWNHLLQVAQENNFHFNKKEFMEAYRSYLTLIASARKY